MLRWAPLVALAFYALWLLWRSRRDHIARALPERAAVEVAATLCALACAAQVLVATFIAPTMFGFFFPGRYLLAALPLFGSGSAGVTVTLALAGAGLVALVASEWRSRRRRIAGR